MAMENAGLGPISPGKNEISFEKRKRKRSKTILDSQVLPFRIYKHCSKRDGRRAKRTFLWLLHAEQEMQDRIIVQ